MGRKGRAVNSSETAYQPARLPVGAGSICGGIGVVALPSTASRGSVSSASWNPWTVPSPLGVAHVVWVVTEYGTADSRGLDMAGRAAAMRQLTLPAHRHPLGR
ncbi:hypothetical protein BH09ACT7_BH09ACT7_50340 [soil metagenome]